MEKNHIINAAFTSVWDGDTCVTTPCKVDMDTREVFDIGQNSDVADAVDHLDREYITVNGQEYPVVPSDEKETEEEFWYA